MALDKLVDSTQLDGAMSHTADAIREKTGIPGDLEWDMTTGFAVAIGDIDVGGQIQSVVSVTPTESEQIVEPDDGYDGIAGVTVGAIPTTYVGSGINQNGSGDLTVSGATVTVPAGYYPNNVSKSVANGSVTTPATAITANPTITVGSDGLITATTSASKSVTPSVSAGYVSSGTAGTITVSGSKTSQLSTQAGITIAPTESVQTAVAAGKYTTGDVKVGAISSTYVGSGINQNDSDDLTVNGATVTVPAGYYAEEASKSVSSGSATTPATTITSSPSITINSSGLITATNSKTQSVTPTVSAGYVSEGTSGTITVDGSNTKQMTVQAAQTITPGTTDQTIASGTYLTGTQTIKGDTDLTAANIKKGVDIFGVTGTFTTTPTDKNALTAAALRSGYAGFINGSQVNGSMPDATFANTATNGKTYADISSSGPVLVAGGYLYINEGYTPYQKISLAKLVPDGSDVKGHAEYILSGHSAYDNDGTLVAGTIPTLASSDVQVSGKTVTIPVGKYTGASGASAVTKSISVGTITSGTASITSLTKTYNSISGKFDVTGSANVSAPTVGTAGYVSSTEGTKNAKTGGATVSATIDKIVGSTTITGTTTAKPSITKQSTPSGVINAASGNATTTAPSSGVYVAVKSAANTGTLTATPSVTTAGYGDATNHGIAGNTATVGASASDTTYIPITTTSASVSGKTVSYGSGWITQGSKSVADGSVTPAINSHTITAPSVACKTNGTGTNIGTTTQPSGTDGTDYWTFVPSGTGTNGSSVANAKATVSAGWIASNPANSANDTKAITPVINEGTARYIPKATATTTNGTVTVTAGTASVDTNGVVTTTTNTGYSVTATATGGGVSVTPSTVTVSAGYNPSSVTASTSEESETGMTVSVTKYIQKGVLSASVSANSSGSASMSATGFTPLASGTSSYFVTLSTSSGSVKAKATVGTEGYVKTESNETSATSVAVNGNGTKLYIPAGSVTTSLGVDGMSTYFNSGTSSDKNVTITPKYTNTAGYKAAITMATNNGGTAYYKIKTVDPQFTGGGVTGTATAAGTNCTLSSTNTSGVSIATACAATRAAVKYPATATAGWVSKAANTGTNLGSNTTNLTSTTYYLTGVELTAGKSFTITVPNGSASNKINFVFTVDFNNNVTVSES